MTIAPLYLKMAKAPKGGVARFITTPDNTKIRFAIWAGGTRGTVVFLAGRTEYIEKYGVTYGQLVQRGFSVVVLDWRGQGLSDHIDGRNDLGDVVRFSDYQQDLETVLNHPDVLALSGPRLMFSHSMGGCLGLRHLMGKHDFKAAVFSAPMWDVILPKGARPVVAVLSGIARAVGLGKGRMPTTNGDFYVTSADFKDNTLTSDPDQWQFMRQHIVDRPEFGLGGASLRWFRGALDEFKRFKSGKLPDIPTLVLYGTDEAIVLPEAIEQVSARLPDNTLIKIQSARHEIWMETPEIQAQAWTETDKFLDGII